MARDAAIVITWGAPVHGRENKSIEVFLETLAFYSRNAEAGVISEPEVFLAEDGSGGMIVLKGRSDAMREMEESEEARRLLAKAQAIVNDLKAHWYLTGDEVQTEISVFAQTVAELGLS